jgi:outer membrane receptor protein involved in Fe transport
MNEELSVSLEEGPRPARLQRYGRLAKKIFATSMVWGAFLLLLTVPCSMPAQVGTADVLGTITDPSGAVIQKAQVSIRNVQTGEVRNALTNDKGDYIINTLPNGKYALSVAASGFHTYTVLNIQLSTDDRARYNITLATGTVTESVQVSAEAAPVLQTDSSTASSLIAEKSVSDLPINARNITNIALLEPGINSGGSNGVSGSGQGDERPTSLISANGQMTNLNNNMIDGFDNNERNIGTVGVRPSVDGIAEMKIDTSAYRADVGRSAGAAINIVTKAGTNNFHGTAYEYLRNDIADARTYFIRKGEADKPVYKMHMFGGSVGGPIRKGKTFFFVDAEWDRLNKGSAETSTIPTLYEEENPGDFTDVSGGVNWNQVLGFSINSTALNYWKLFPAPTSTATSSNYVSAPATKQNSTTVDGRIDHRFTTNDMLFVRYAYNPVDGKTASAFPESSTGIVPGGSKFKAHTQNLQFDYVHIFKGNLLVDLKAGYTRVDLNKTPYNWGNGVDDKLGVVNGHIATMSYTDGMTVMGGPGFAYAMLGDSMELPVMSADNTFQYSGSVTWTHGNHAVKMGAGLIRRQVMSYNETYPDGFLLFSSSGGWENGTANFLSGNIMMELRGNTLIQPGYRAWEASAYAMDDWRVSSRLTVNAGIRYDIFTPFTEAQNRYSNFDVDTQSFILGATDSHIGVKTTYTDFGPRLGFAYSITPSTIVRGGYGISFYPPDVGTMSAGSAHGLNIIPNPNPPYAYNYTGYNKNLAEGLAIPSAVDVSTFKSNSNVTTVSSLASNLRPSNYQQYNVALQRDFRENVFTLAWVGVSGHQLLRTLNKDQGEAPGTGNSETPYLYATDMPYITTIAYNYNGNSSNYNAMQLIYSRRFRNGLDLNANWTWAHGMDTIAAPNVTPLSNAHTHVDYGNSTVDLRHRASVSAIYDVPFGKSFTGIKSQIFKGWQLNNIFFWQTGGSFDVYSSDPAVNIEGVSYDRPNVKGSAKVSHQTLNKWFETSAFSVQTEGTLGDLGKNQFYGPHDRRDDFSVMKNFPLTENYKLQFRAECFNLSNTPNFDVPSGVIQGWYSDGTPLRPDNTASSTFGEVTSTTDNSREFQFALKLLF